MGPETSGGKRGRVAIVVAPVATLIACSVLFLNLVRYLAPTQPLGLPLAESVSTAVASSHLDLGQHRLMPAPDIEVRCARQSPCNCPLGSSPVRPGRRKR